MSFTSLQTFTRRRLERLARGYTPEERLRWQVRLDELERTINARGKTFLNFANYDYLGLATRPEVIAAGKLALETYGPGVYGSRLVGGQRTFHEEFEHDFAEFIGHDAALMLISGYLTNSSLIPHLLSARDIIILDEHCHNSAMMGARFSRATIHRFRHNDLDHLEEILKEVRASARNCLISVESLYSMEGDIVDLPRLLDLKEEYASWLMVDEAHSLGVLGKSGRGISEHYGTDPKRIDLLIGTMSKTLASSGGIICADRQILDYLRYSLSGFVYSVGVSPVTCATAHAALKIMSRSDEFTRKLQDISEYFVSQASQIGFNTGHALGRAIVPLFFKDNPSTLAASDALLEDGIYAPAVVQVGVPLDAPRIRFFMSARHTRADIDRVIAILANFKSFSRQTPLA